MPRVRSPDGHLVVSVDESDDRISLSAVYRDEPILERSPVGLRLDGDDPVGRPPLAVEGERTIQTNYETAAGKRRRHRHEARQITVSLGAASDPPLELDVRVAPDGLAYRYRLPGEGDVTVTGEQSGFRVPPGEVWYHPYNVRHESIGRSTAALAASGEMAYPATFQLGPERWLLLTETDVTGRYAASRLRTETKDALYSVTLPAGAIEGSRPLTTPWRVAIVGDLAAVVESNLVTDLVDEGLRSPPDWARPGRVAWSWWADRDSPADVATQRRYVEYAADRGWEYVLLDNGWSADWVPGLVEYAAELGVGVFLWERWQELDTAAKQAERLDRWAAWGVAGIKVDFMNADSQERMRFYDDMAAATADRELMLNFHGSIVPLGLRRRWPHVMTYEGVYGAEQHPRQTPTHNTILPFTRNVLGPMDYTPVAFSAPARLTTAAHELALSVVFESGLQHVAEGIDTLADWPLAEAFLETLPAAWDEIAFLGGRPGVEATIARRADDEWFLGTITAGAERTAGIELGSLDMAGPYRAEILLDEDRETLRRDRRTVASSDPIDIPLLENGGCCMRLRPE